MSIWKEEISLESIKQFAVKTAVEFLDVRFTELGDDYLVATLPVDHRTVQPLGYLNGGMSCFLIETVASTAANYCVNQSECFCVGLEINANHLRPVTEGRVTAKASPIHLGSQTQVWKTELFNDQGDMVCVGRMTMAVVSRQKRPKEARGA